MKFELPHMQHYTLIFDTYHQVSQPVTLYKMDEVFSLVQEKCLLMNISILENMIKEFELKEEIHIKNYKAEINNVSSFMSQ